MKLRQRAWILVIAISLAATLASAWTGAYFTALALAFALLFATRRLLKPVSIAGTLSDWFIALEGKDPFNPDAKPRYKWQGFATTFVAALRVANHPTLTGKTLYVFRDEVDDETWRALVTRIRHGAHAVSDNRKLGVWF